MHDNVYIRRNGVTCIGARYLRQENGGVFQSIFYAGRCRADPAGYASFSGEDPAMNASAQELLAELVDEAARLGQPI